LTGGILRHFRAFSTPEQNPALKVLSRPAHPQVTQTVSPPITKLSKVFIESMENSTLSHVFLSYSNFDKEKGEKLYRRLKEDGINVWSVQENLLPGQNQKIEVTNIIKNSYAVLVCLSQKTTNEIGEIQTYIKIAVEAGTERPEGEIFLIPVLLEECRLPFSLQGFFPATLLGGNYFDDKGYTKLLSALKSKPSKVDITTLSNEQNDSRIEETMSNIEQIIEKNKVISEARKKELRFAVIGLTGAGKSSTINSLFGEEVAKVNPYKPTTHSVSKYSNESLGIKYTIFDTPGLGESDDESQNLDLEYINLIKREISEVDCVLYVTHLDDPRIRRDEKICIRLFSNAFGESFWKHAVIVFTLKHSITIQEFNDLLLNRSEIIRSEIHKHTNGDISSEIPVVPISINSKTTPDNKEWEAELFMNIVNKISDIGGLSFILANANRIDNGEIPLTESQKEHVASKFSTPLISDDVKKTAAAALLGTELVAASLILLGGPITLTLGIAAGVAGTFYLISQSEK